MGMTVLSANGEVVRSLRGDVQDASLGVESPRIDGEDILEGQGRSLSLGFNGLPRCNCRGGRKCKMNPDGGAEKACEYDCKARGYKCNAYDWNCGFGGSRKCWGYNSSSNHNQ